MVELWGGGGKWSDAWEQKCNCLKGNPCDYGFTVWRSVEEVPEDTLHLPRCNAWWN